MKPDEAEIRTEDVHSGNAVSARRATAGHVKVSLAFRSHDFTRIPFGPIGLINDRSRERSFGRAWKKVFHVELFVCNAALPPAIQVADIYREMACVECNMLLYIFLCDVWVILNNTACDGFNVNPRDFRDFAPFIKRWKRGSRIYKRRGLEDKFRVIVRSWVPKMLILPLTPSGCFSVIWGYRARRVEIWACGREGFATGDNDGWYYTLDRKYWL